MGNQRGLPGSLTTSLPACHGLRTPADLSIQAITDGLVLSSVHVKTLDVRAISISKLYQHFRVHGHPYGLPGFPVYASPVLFVPPFFLNSATGATLGTGGWLTLYPTGTSTPQDVPDLSRRDDNWNHFARSFPSEVHMQVEFTFSLC